MCYYEVGPGLADELRRHHPCPVQALSFPTSGGTSGALHSVWSTALIEGEYK